MIATQQQMYLIGAVCQIKSKYNLEEYMWQEVQGKAIDKGITWQLLFGGPITHSEKSKGFEDTAPLDSGPHKHVQPCVHKHTNMLCLNAQAFDSYCWGEQRFPQKSLSRAYIKSLEERLACCSEAHTSGNYPHKHVAEKKGGYCQSMFWFDL